MSWHRYREPFLDRNPEPGSWDHAMTWMSMAVPAGDEVYLYYGGYARGHKIEARTERQIGLARMKKDRYVAMKPTGAAGTLRTRPFVMSGDRLTINASAARSSACKRTAKLLFLLFAIFLQPPNFNRELFLERLRFVETAAAARGPDLIFKEQLLLRDPGAKT